MNDLLWMSIVPYLAINHRSYLYSAAQPYITGPRQFPATTLSQDGDGGRKEGGKEGGKVEGKEGRKKGEREGKREEAQVKYPH